VKWVTTIAVSLFVVLALPAHAAHQVETGMMTIRLVSIDTATNVLTDRPPEQQVSKGDLIVVTATLRNAVAQLGHPKGALVGDDAVIFRILSRAEANVIVETNLPGGWLRAASRVRLGAKQTYTVTGGRGRFAKARGTLESKALPCHCERRLKLYRLQLP
jgi:hypothetical protein